MALAHEMVITGSLTELSPSCTLGLAAVTPRTKQAALCTVQPTEGRSGNKVEDVGAPKEYGRPTMSAGGRA